MPRTTATKVVTGTMIARPGRLAIDHRASGKHGSARDAVWERWEVCSTKLCCDDDHPRHPSHADDCSGLSHDAVGQARAVAYELLNDAFARRRNWTGSTTTPETALLITMLLRGA